MVKDQIHKTYRCPYAATCPIHKNCRVVTAASPITKETIVWQQCPAIGKNQDGQSQEILLYIGLEG